MLIKRIKFKLYIYYLFFYLYFWKYDHKINLRNDDCIYRGETKKNAYIPISFLTKIN